MDKLREERRGRKDIHAFDKTKRLPWMNSASWRECGKMVFEGALNCERWRTGILYASYQSGLKTKKDRN